MKKIEKIFTNEVGYLVMALLIMGQCTVGEWFYLGQFVYLFANALNLIRDFILKRPAPDKIKNTAFVAITLGIILIRFF